jgi:signal transduction histidine kinase
LCGFAQVLLHVVKGETRIDAPQVRRALQHIDTQAMKLDGLIAQLLDLSRIEAGRLSLDREVVDLTAVVQGVVAAAQARTSAHTFVVDAPAPIAACLDPLRIEQVLVNLVNNAIKYSPDGGTIDITVTQHGEVAQVTVRDHGLGSLWHMSVRSGASTAAWRHRTSRSGATGTRWGCKGGP